MRQTQLIFYLDWDSWIRSRRGVWSRVSLKNIETMVTSLSAGRPWPEPRSCKTTTRRKTTISSQTAPLITLLASVFRTPMARFKRIFVSSSSLPLEPWNFVHSKLSILRYCSHSVNPENLWKGRQVVSKGGKEREREKERAVCASQLCDKVIETREANSKS